MFIAEYERHIKSIRAHVFEFIGMKENAKRILVGTLVIKSSQDQRPEKMIKVGRLTAIGADVTKTG